MHRYIFKNVRSKQKIKFIEVLPTPLKSADKCPGHTDTVYPVISLPPDVDLLVFIQRRHREPLPGEVGETCKVTHTVSRVIGRRKKKDSHLIFPRLKRLRKFAKPVTHGSVNGSDKSCCHSSLSQKYKGNSYTVGCSVNPAAMNTFQPPSLPGLLMREGGCSKRFAHNCDSFKCLDESFPRRMGISSYRRLADQASEKVCERLSRTHAAWCWTQTSCLLCCPSGEGCQRGSSRNFSGPEEGQGEAGAGGNGAGLA